ncbi:uL15 family ribosomal protein [Patescibacteria group bacterium]|nr:uL15 family ribosomal protein [Patescibacteria group bacterium]
MQLHELQPKHKPKKRKRIARGGKRGAYSGRGQKGQKSRAGRRMSPIIRSWIKRYPKLRGYRQKPIGLKPAIINVAAIEKEFEAGSRINPQILLERKLISKIKGKTPEVKILGKGELTKKLTFEKCEISKSAEEKIKKAGGITR